MLKQDLATSYDYNLEGLYANIDDCNFKFIDTSNLKRFLVKCCIYATDALLIAIIRRMDLDADARLSKREFIDGVQPLENFTKGSLTEMKKSVKRSSKMSSAMATRKSGSLSGTKRPMTAAAARQRSPVGSFQSVIQSNTTSNQRDFMARNS